MARRARKVGLPAEGVDLIARAHREAMSVREGGPRALPSDHHPAFLHPGRTVLILIDDLGERDARVLAVGALAESRDLELRVSRAVAAEVWIGVEAHSAEEALAWWEALPRPDWGAAGSGSDGELLEQLVIAPGPVQRVALCEALDQLRHAHLWEDAAERRRAAELAETVLAPLAPRVHPVLDRRLSWWIRRVGRELRDG